MSANRKVLLCHYRYDALDRLANYTPSDQADIHCFYLKNRLTTEIQGSKQRSIFQQNDHLLAQQQRQEGVVKTQTLATDQQRSVLQALGTMKPPPFAYTPYGHRARNSALLSPLGFNGERPDPVTGHYLLGNGYRAFNPALMRFNNPDSMSPFGKGGLNAYAYGQGDPINTIDPTGHFKLLNPLKGFMNWAKLRPPKTTVYVHKIKLRVPDEMLNINFIDNPTKRFPGLERPLDPALAIQEIEDFELLLKGNSAAIIRAEMQAAHIIKLGKIPQLRAESYGNLLQSITRQRRIHRENLEWFDRRVLELTSPPTFYEIMDAPPSYNEALFLESLSLRAHSESIRGTKPERRRYSS